ncbi:MAG: hypothetical protein RBU45_01080 [Myxococcota bacterium]|jgi:poly(A) polymerase|nr:hypothetical protein [Myxococcota bacterium]
MDWDSPPHRVYHPLPPGLLDEDVVTVVRRLRRYHFEAYLVGGCVRDLLLGVTPKDFDVATAAQPREIRRIFRNSKIIGRRFRLAHIFFRAGKVIEVATFRRAPWAERLDNGVELAEDEDLLITDDNLFGTPAEDARRRDFTINGLFYDLHTREILDHVHGLPDITARTVRAIGDPEIRIQEDPVRILRAIKFASRLDLTIDPLLWAAMLHHGEEIRRAAPPRLLEEIFRLLRGPHARTTLTLLLRSGQLAILLPEVQEYLVATGETEAPPPEAPVPPTAGRFWRLLELLDETTARQGVPEDALLLAVVGYLPILHRLARENPTNLGAAVDQIVGEFATRMRLPRRETERLKQVFITERRLAARRRRSGGHRDALLRRPGLGEALFLHELGRRLEGDPLDRILQLRRDLQQRGEHPAPREGEPVTPPPAAPLPPAGEPDDPARPRRRPRRSRWYGPRNR